jgi:restriction endonuclease S subunit
MKAGWQTQPFEDCIEKVTYTTKVQRKDFLDAGAFPVISQEEAYINGYWDNEDDVFRVNNPLVIFGDHTKVLKYVDFDFVLGADGVKLLPPKDFLVPKFFFYQLQTAQLDSLGYARHYKLLKELEIKFPGRAEQHRIVAILDEAFDGIATAKANAEKNLQNARALFESHLQRVFTERGEGWSSTTLEKATGGVFTGPFGSLLHKSDYVADGIPLVNPAHITAIGIEPDMQKTVSKETAERLSSYIMREGDIVIGRRGEMGRCALVTDVEDGWLCGTGSFFIKPSKHCNPGYLVRLLRSNACKQKLEKIAGGAVMPNLSNTDLGNLSIDLPPLERQKTILREIGTIADETQRLESLYQQKLTSLDDLKKSLLHQAFSGHL